MKLPREGIKGFIGRLREVETGALKLRLSSFEDAQQWRNAIYLELKNQGIKREYTSTITDGFELVYWNCGIYGRRTSAEFAANIADVFKHEDVISAAEISGKHDEVLKQLREEAEKKLVQQSKDKLNGILEKL